MYINAISYKKPYKTELLFQYFEPKTSNCVILKVQLVKNQKYKPGM